jgi:hypothetical protein
MVRLADRRAALVPAAGRSILRGAVRSVAGQLRGRRPSSTEPSLRPRLGTTVIPYQEHESTMSVQSAIGGAIEHTTRVWPDRTLSWKKVCEPEFAS